MISLTRAWLVVMALSIVPVCEAERLHLKWEEVAAAVEGRVVSVALPSGAAPRGRVLAVNEDTLVLDVRGRGPMSIERPFVSVLKIERSSIRGRLLGALLGVVAGAGAGAAAASAFDDRWSAGALATWAGIAVGSATAGFIAGRRADNDTTYIVVQQYPHHVRELTP